MPYIDSDRRAAFDFVGVPKTVGELTYCLTLPIKVYLRGKRKDFATFAEVLGALASVSGEFNRRVLWPYENEKIKSNGDAIFWDK